MIPMVDCFLIRAIWVCLPACQCWRRASRPFNRLIDRFYLILLPLSIISCLVVVWSFKQQLAAKSVISCDKKMFCAFATTFSGEDDDDDHHHLLLLICVLLKNHLPNQPNWRPTFNLKDEVVCPKGSKELQIWVCWANWAKAFFYLHYAVFCLLNPSSHLLLLQQQHLQILLAFAYKLVVPTVKKPA